MTSSIGLSDETIDLGTGVYLSADDLAHPGEIHFEIGNTTGSPVTIHEPARPTRARLID